MVTQRKIIENLTWYGVRLSVRKMHHYAHLSDDPWMNQYFFVPIKGPRILKITKW